MKAESELIASVNAALKAAAAAYGWHLVTGIAAQSAAHGVARPVPVP